MQKKITLTLSREAYDDLARLSDALGFSPELAAEYAIRLVHACMREGLLTDVPSAAWPREANACEQLVPTGTAGKVIAFPGAAREKSESR